MPDTTISDLISDVIVAATTPYDDEITCLICERVNPLCGWEQPVLVQEAFGMRWSVCQDCVDRRAVGQD